MRSTPRQKPKKTRAKRTASAVAAPAAEPPVDDTRARLLEAAARTIAERGFAATTVREICRRAGTNVAAVNYHFRSKEALEAQTLIWAMTRVQDADLLSAAATDLPAVIRALARQILGTADDLHARLMMRAMLEPNPALDTVVRDFVEPRIRVIEQSLRPHMREATARALRLTALSVVSQIVYYRLAAPVATRLLRETSADGALANEVAEHVAAFTMKALAAPVSPVRARRRKEPRP